MDDCIVPGWYTEFDLIPGWRDVSMGTLKDHQFLLTTSEMVPLGVGACHVSQQGATWTPLGIQYKWQVGCKGHTFVLCDKSRKAVLSYEFVKSIDIIFAKSFWDIHRLSSPGLSQYIPEYLYLRLLSINRSTMITSRQT